MKILSDNEAVYVSGAGPLSDFDEVYQYGKEFVKEFWRGFKAATGIEDSEK